MGTPDVTALIHTLTGGTPPRVWSLIVSLLGDLAQRDDAPLSSAMLTQVLAPIGIQPQAIRVALHRLRKEDWITATRSGRTSLYALSDKGLRETRAASPRIYGTSAPQEAWLVVHPQGQGLGDALPIAPQVSVSPVHPAHPDCHATKLTPDAPLPAWMRDKLCPVPLRNQTADLVQRLAQVSASMGTAPDDEITCLTLRLLVLHGWRRIALRIPPLPAHAFPDDWHGPQAERLARDLMRRLPLPEL